MFQDTRQFLTGNELQPMQDQCEPNKNIGGLQASCGREGNTEESNAAGAQGRGGGVVWRGLWGHQVLILVSRHIVFVVHLESRDTFFSWVLFMEFLLIYLKHPHINPLGYGRQVLWFTGTSFDYEAHL